jgi:protein-disulfide isomerase
MDIAEGRAAGVIGTPTVFIGTISNDRLMATDRVIGAVAITFFQAVVDRLLASHR